MVNQEQPKKPETAIDLTEEERSALLGAGARLLKSRGLVIEPKPTTKYLDDDGQEYRPEPHLEANISSDELSACSLDYDSLVLQGSDLEFGNDGPAVIYIGVTRMATRTIPSIESQPMALIGSEQQGVQLSRDPHLGIVVDEEVGDGVFYAGPDAVDTYTVNSGLEDEHTTELRGPQLYMEKIEPLSRQELVDLTAGLEKLK
jgi:hypothetical protein